jgi:transposase-like protein
MKIPTSLPRLKGFRYPRAVIAIRGEKFWLWRAVDADGAVLDILVSRCL